MLEYRDNTFRIYPLSFCNPIRRHIAKEAKKNNGTRFPFSILV